MCLILLDHLTGDSTPPSYWAPIVKRCTAVPVRHLPGSSNNVPSPSPTCSPEEPRLACQRRVSWWPSPTVVSPYQPRIHATVDISASIRCSTHPRPLLSTGNRTIWRRPISSLQSADRRHPLRRRGSCGPHNDCRDLGPGHHVLADVDIDDTQGVRVQRAQALATQAPATAGTVSACVLSVPTSGLTQGDYRFAAGPPDTHPFEVLSTQLRSRMR